MLFAERYRKLGRDSSRAHDRAEDLLTSTAFQLLRYVPLQSGLLAVLARVRRVGLQSGVPEVVPTAPTWLPFAGVDEAHLEFWPRWPGAGEPDVVVRLLREGHLTAEFVVEVKLDAPKSPRGRTAPDGNVSEGPEEEHRRPDQLWDYYDHLRRTPGAHARGLVYLTSHTIPPLDELRESLDCCAAARAGGWLGWLSWCDVWTVMNEAGTRELPARDMADILAAKGFRSFDGFGGTPPAAPPQQWRFFHPWFSASRSWARPAGAQRFWTTTEE